VEGSVGTGGDDETEGFAVVGGVVGADLEVVGDDLLAGAVDVDAGADEVFGTDRFFGPPWHLRSRTRSSSQLE
jgi:hypothetical protein